MYSFDDTGNAERFIDCFGEVVRYGYVNKKWFYYDGRRWISDYVGATLRMIDQTVEAMGKDLQLYLAKCEDIKEAEAVEKAFNKHVKASRSNNRKTAMLKQSAQSVPVLPEDFDRHKLLLNVPNGTVDLNTGQIQTHNRNDFITKVTYTEYKQHSAPRWELFLDEIFGGDRELIRYIQKAVGYSLTGETSEDCVFFCFGQGRNGKSTFLEAIRWILGDYAANIQPESIMVKAMSSSNTGDIARLRGARFVTCSEPGEGMRLNEGLVKQLTGGDVITASKKYEDEFEFHPEFKLWMSTNHKPIIRGTDLGIWSRVRLIPFTQTFALKDCDKALPHKLRQEAPGILQWAVEGCLLWRSEGLALPAAIQQATDEYRGEMDVLSAFISDCCHTGYGETKAADLFQAYLKWAAENNEYKMTNTRFGREIRGRFERVKKEKGLVYLNVKLTDEYKSYNVSIG
jgi:putative DNA primase/helicase